MDDHRFDDLTRRFAATVASRRGLVGLAIGFGASFAGARHRSAGATCPEGQYLGAGSRCLCRTTGRPPGPDGCPCGAGQTRCDDGCRDLSSDLANCGVCGIACAAVGQVCRAGACECAAGFGVCGDACLDLENDPAHCGACENVCPSDHPLCRAGVCSCPDGLTDCDDTCVDLTNDPSHCGTCATVCPESHPTCSGGTCSCVDGLTDCGDVCADLQTDESHCGTCAISCTKPGSICSVGQCVCPTGTKNCGNACCPTAAVCTAQGTCCVPKTCAEQGKECGTIGDGCGRNLNCGTCGFNHKCVSNICFCSKGNTRCSKDCTCMDPVDHADAVCAYTFMGESRPCTHDSDCPGDDICGRIISSRPPECFRIGQVC